MSVLILAEHDGHCLKPAINQIVTAAKTWGEPVHVLLIGEDTTAMAQAAATISGIERVVCVEAPHLKHLLAEDVAPLLARLGREYQAIIAAHSAFSKNILPRAAALLDVAMISDVLAITRPGRYICPMYAGNVHATVESADSIQVLTVRASSFPVTSGRGSAEIISKEAPTGTQQVRWLGKNCAASDHRDLVSARVVVAGGHSLGSAEKFESVLMPLADKLGAALGATRSAVDAGYAPNDIQVGQTGTIVAPELYIAIGISGAVQHTAGMRDSKTIVAINQDPDAPIFQVADYGLVADLFEAVPALTAALN
ncbi:MAG: electron transfer flavoprotein subunit alpha/FixB family protein [Sulfuriferula sp.]